MFVHAPVLSCLRSASPGLRRVVLPVGLSITQCRAQLAEQTAKIARSSRRHVVEAMRYVREVSKVALVEVVSLRSQVEGRAAALEMEATMSMSNAIGEASHWLEWGLEVVELNSIVTSVHSAQVVVEGLCKELQAKFEQDRVELQQR